jgi:hypothetical protein
MGRATSNDGAKKSARDVDAFLAAVLEEARATLEKIRKTIRAAAPKSTEGIGYGIPTFYHQGLSSDMGRQRTTAASTS